MNSRNPLRTVVAPLLCATALATLSACGGGTTAAPAPGTIPVEATDTTCGVTPPNAPKGKVTFQVTNKGTKTTEFYLYGPDNQVLSEVEGIGPGLTREMTVEAPQPGTYTTACKPGMKGDGIRGSFTVTP